MLFQGSKAMLINTTVNTVFFHSSASFRSALGDECGNRDSVEKVMPCSKRDSLETVMTVVTVTAWKQ
jgi:hypothetical protein